MARAEASVESLSRSLRGVQGLVLGALGIGGAQQALSGLVSLADGYANVSAKLRLATDSELAYAAAKAETFAISQRTSTSLDSTVTLYSRLAQSVEGLGVSQGEVAALTETVNQALAISGATGAESASAILQLSQAFGAGALRGEEFNAVNEASPRLMQALAESIGVPRGALKALAEEGKLTSDVLLQAFSGERAAEIAAEFSKIPVTIQRAWTQVRNATQQALGELDQDTGASAGVAAALVTIAENADAVVVSIGLIGTVATTAIAGRLVGSLQASVAASLAAAAAQTATAGAIGTTAVATTALRTAMVGLGTALGGLPALAIAATAAVVYLATAESDAERATEALDDALEELAASTDRTRQTKIDAAIAARDQAKADLEAAQAALTLRAAQQESPLARGGDAVSRKLAADYRAAADEVQRLKDRLEELNRAIADQTQKQAAAAVAQRAATDEYLASQAALADIQFLTKPVQSFVDALKKQNEQLKESAIQARGGAVAVAEYRLQQLQLVGADVAVVQAARDQIAELKKNVAALDAAKDSTRALRDAKKDLREEEQKLDELQRMRDREVLAGEVADRERDRAYDQAAAGIKRVLADLELEGRLLGMTTLEREDFISAMQIEEEIRRQVAEAAAKGVDVSKLNAEAAIKEAVATDAKNRALQREKKIREQLGLFGGRVDRQGNVQAFNTFPELIGGAIAEAINDGAEGFNRVFSRWNQSWERAREEGPAAQTSFVADTITQVADFASNVIGAFERNADAPLRAIAEVAAMIPGSVGDVARAVQAIDSLFGGRLLGTNYEVQRQGRNVAFGAGGVTGSTFVTETRQRALFGGTARRTTTTALDAEAQAQLTAFFDQVAAAVGQAARALGAEVPALVAGAFREEFDKNGKLISQVSTVAGRSYTEGFQQFQQRLTAESLLLVVGQFDSAVQQIAERWRADAAKLLDGAQFLLQAQAAIQQGEALLGEGSTLTQTADFVQDFARAGETLAQTFARLQVSSKLLTEATDLMGVALDLSREEFIRFAADITDAAGGVERAAQLWQGYFETFYSAEERAARSVNNTANRRTEELADIGLAPDISMAEFRVLFEEALPTLSAEAVVEWLEAADAIRQANAAQRAYAEALRAEADFLRDIGNAILEQDGSEFDQTLARIRDQTAGYIEQANALARSRGEEAASARDLAMIHRWAANEVRRAIEQLRGQARDVISQLGYNDLDAQIAELEGRSNGVYQSQVDGLNDVADAAADAFEEMQSAIADLNDYLEDMLLGDLSPLSPEEQLDEAQRRLNETAARALQGDASAVQQLPQLADAYLRLVRDRDASGADYRAEFERVRGLLQSVAGMDTGVAPPRDIQLVPSEELRALYAQRDQRAAEEEAQRRLALASDLATYLRDLAAASNESLFAVAERLGVDFDRFVGDLGGQAEASTAEAVAGLAAIANQLNVELSELGEELGLALGELADENSLLNDAFELALAGLPEEFRTQLEPALQDVENAASTEESAAALERLEDLTDALPEEFRLRLAPYLANIDAAPFEALNQLGLLSAVDANTAQAVTLLEQILVAVGGELADDDAPATAAGKALLSSPLDFVPTKLSDDIREGNQVIVDELAAMRRELEQLRREARENAQDQREATGNGAERTANAIAGAIDRQTAELTIRRVAS